MAKKLTKTKAGNPIIYIPVRADYSSLEGDPFIKPEEIPVALVKARDGNVYQIPIDPKTGKVPESALFERFVNVEEGDREGHIRNIAIDLAQFSNKMNIQPKGGYTPEELIKTGWYQHPNESDILGIDDPATSAMKIIEGLSKTGQEAGRKIAILTSPESRQRIEKVLRENFTGAELKRAVKDRGIIITEANNLGPGVGGYYMGRQPGVDVPRIVLRPNSSEDTITHEFIHHERLTDPTRKGVARTSFPVMEDGRRDPVMATLMGREDLVNLEEAATVAEAAVRTRQPEVRPTGYYIYIDGSPGTHEAVKEAYDHDRDVLTKNSKGQNKPKRGKNAVNAVNKNFSKTKISTLRVDKKGKKAIDVYEQHKQEYEKPVPTSSKKEEVKIPTASKPMATANIIGPSKSSKATKAKNAPAKKTAPKKTAAKKAPAKKTATKAKPKGKR